MSAPLCGGHLGVNGHHWVLECCHPVWCGTRDSEVPAVCKGAAGCVCMPVGCVCKGAAGCDCVVQLAAVCAVKGAAGCGLLVDGRTVEPVGYVVLCCGSRDIH